MDENSLGKSTDELFDALMARESFVTVDDECITINVKYEYQISRDRCSTTEQIFGWMVHLCEKTWMNPIILREFAYKACAAAGLEMPHP